MFIVAMAVGSCAVALFTGLAAVGQGKRFVYRPYEILKGRRDAIFYIWLTISTIFSLARTVTLVLWGFKHNWEATDLQEVIRMWLQTGTGLLFSASHFHIMNELHQPACRVEYLWGNKRVDAAN